MKIVVLAGGISTEREVSISSGTGVCSALRQRGHQAILVDVFCGDERLSPENAFDGAYEVQAVSYTHLGLDYAQKYRNLPYIGVVSFEE